MRLPLAFFIGAALLGCASRSGLAPEAPGAAGAGGPGGGGGATGAGGAAGAESAAGLCQNRTGRRSDQIALVGYDGADMALVHEDGTTLRVHGPGARNRFLQRNGFIAAYDVSSTTTWKAQLFDVTGRLRAEASGDDPPAPPGKRQEGIGWLYLMSDGTATFDFANTSDDLVLTPDGRVRKRPAFMTEPDAAGWVGANVITPPATLGVPAMLNVETGEIRKLSLLAPGDTWAPMVSGARRLYLAEVGGGVVLVDESPDGARRFPLPGFARKDLEVVVTQLANGGRAAHVSLHDGVRKNLPVWLYDLQKGALASALPDGALPADCISSPDSDGHITVYAGGDSPQASGRLWTVDLVAGAILDYRAGLTVRRTAPASGGSPNWSALADNAKRVYRYDRAAGTVEDLHITGDLVLSGRRALVMRDMRPQAVVSVDTGVVTPISGGESLPPGMAQSAGRWAVGYASLPSAPWAPGIPLWRIDLETAEARAFSAPDASLVPLMGITLAPLFASVGTPILPAGQVGVMLYDGVGAGLYIAEPGVPWRAVGRRVRQVTWVGWAAGSTFAVAAEKDCNCYGPLMLAWPTPPAAAPEHLSGTSLQFLAPDGTDVLPPIAGEHLAGLDESASCALVQTDAREFLIYDTVARTRRSLGRFESLGWFTEAR